MGYGGVIQTLVGENAPPGLLYSLDKKVYPPLADTSREQLWWLMVTVHEQDGDLFRLSKTTTQRASVKSAVTEKPYGDYFSVIFA